MPEENELLSLYDQYADITVYSNALEYALRGLTIDDSFNKLIEASRTNNFWDIDELVFKQHTKNILDTIKHDHKAMIRAIFISIDDAMDTIAYYTITDSMEVDVGYDCSTLPNRTDTLLQLGLFSDMRHLLNTWHSGHTIPTYQSGHGLYAEPLGHEISTEINEAIDSYIIHVIKEEFSKSINSNDVLDDIEFTFTEENDTLVSVSTTTTIVIGIMNAMEEMGIPDCFKSFNLNRHLEILNEIVNRGEASNAFIPRWLENKMP